MSQSYEITCLSVALSPITHMSGTEGNEAILSREAVATPVGVQYVPCLSGNQIRHVMVRAPGWRWLIDLCGLAGKLTLPQLNFMMHGGALSESSRAEDLARVAEWQRLFPLGRLIGGCLPDQVLAGSLRVHRGTFVCRENAARLLATPATLAAIGPDVKLRAAQSLVDGWQYTRSGSSAREVRLLKDGEVGSDDLMIFAGQSVIPGAAFVHGFSIPHGSELELGALLWSLGLWADAGGNIGGMAARGHGRLATAIVDGVDESAVAAAVDAYKAHAEAVKDEAVAWLGAAFAKRAEPKPAKGKGKPKPVEPEPEPEPTPAPTRDDGPSLFGDDA